MHVKSITLIINPWNWFYYIKEFKIQISSNDNCSEYVLKSFLYTKITIVGDFSVILVTPPCAFKAGIKIVYSIIHKWKIMGNITVMCERRPYTVIAHNKSVLSNNTVKSPVIIFFHHNISSFFCYRFRDQFKVTEKSLVIMTLYKDWYIYDILNTGQTTTIN